MPISTKHTHTHAHTLCESEGVFVMLGMYMMRTRTFISIVAQIYTFSLICSNVLCVLCTHNSHNHRVCNMNGSSTTHCIRMDRDGLYASRMTFNGEFRNLTCFRLNGRHSCSYTDEHTRNYVRALTVGAFCLFLSTLRVFLAIESSEQNPFDNLYRNLTSKLFRPEQKNSPGSL